MVVDPVLVDPGPYIERGPDVITALSYIGFESPNSTAWNTFGPDVLGVQLAVPGADGAVRLRVDDHDARITIHPGPRERLAYLGWDVGDADGLAAVTTRLTAAGVDATPDPTAARARNVAEVSVFLDPFGVRHELAYGLASPGSFAPGRPISGFVTGREGLGHAVLVVPDLDVATAFFSDVLGFLHSDDIEQGIQLRFFHCNVRHHTLALAHVPGMVGFHHLMIEVGSLDDVGSGLDIVNERGIPLAMSLGRHTNDLMTSFYVRTPSGFEVEYGTGGRLIDDSSWDVGWYDAMSLWGHKPPPDGPLLPELLAPLDVATGASS